MTLNEILNCQWRHNVLKQVFGNHVVVKLREVEEITAGGLLLPTQKGKKQQIGEVVMVGPGLMLENGQRAPMDIKPGMVVMFQQFAGTQVSDGGEDYIVLNANDVICEV